MKGDNINYLRRFWICKFKLFSNLKVGVKKLVYLIGWELKIFKK